LLKATAYRKRDLNLIMLNKLILSFLILLPFHLLAQNNVLTGNVYDNDNRSQNLQGATIKNLNTKLVVLTDKEGHFAISAKIGDLVSFGMAGYKTDTVYLTNLFPKNVFLRAAVTNLNTVDITSTKVSPYLDAKNPSAMPAKRVDYAKERGGLRLNLGYGKFRRQQAKVQELEENDVYLEEINANFNEEVIKKAVKFEGGEIRDFMGLYRPTVAQIKAERPFNYNYYIVTSYHAWSKLPADKKKLPSLKNMRSN
jgi:hypothetical protein